MSSCHVHTFSVVYAVEHSVQCCIENTLVVSDSVIVLANASTRASKIQGKMHTDDFPKSLPERTCTQ